MKARRTRTAYNSQMPGSDAVTIACVRDTHELHAELDVPDADILVHAGDYTMFSRSAAAILDFNDWLGDLPHRHRVVIPGNHEFYLANDPSRRSLITNATTLINESVTIMGLRIWGSLVTPLTGAAFGLCSPNDRARLYATIPDAVDIIVSHGPPFGILDRPLGARDHAGCRELLRALHRLTPKMVICGHIHGAQGLLEKDGTLFVNAAMMGRDGNLTGVPIVLRLPRRQS